jgi:hypothetical protein
MFEARALTNSLKIHDDIPFCFGFWVRYLRIGSMNDKCRDEPLVESKGSERPEGSGAEQAAIGVGNLGLV